jgi:hypothetical protein
MIADKTPPFGPVFRIFPFKDLFYGKMPGIPAGIEADYPEASAPYIGDYVSPFKNFPPGNPGDNAVKMNRLPGLLIRQCRSEVPNGFAAVGANRHRQRDG